MNMEDKGASHIHDSDLNSRYLCFYLGVEEYAIPLLSVREVIAVPEITLIPRSVPHFLGIMNLRGQVISVFDLRAKLSIEPTKGLEGAVIICDLNPNSVGFLVDTIDRVVCVNADKMSEKPDIQGLKKANYIRGLFREKNKLIVLLDISKVMCASEELSA